MRPILLQGHDRSVTQIKYNREGDLIFSCAKDKLPSVWWSANGERLGTFGTSNRDAADDEKGHNGVVWTVDVDWETKHLFTGSGDASWRLWNCETGRTLNSGSTKTSVRYAAFSYSGNEVFYVTDQQQKNECRIVVKDIRVGSHMKSEDSVFDLAVHDGRISAAVWGLFDESIIGGHANGDLSVIELRSKDFAPGKEKVHQGEITDIQKSKDGIMLVTSSKDTTAKLFDSISLDCLKTYKADRPVNSAAISPIRQHILLGGGQEAMQVTTTDMRQGRFEARFFHMVYEEEFARVKGHFGPINTLAFHPDGQSFSTGGEDGYIRVHNLDPDYFEFDLST